MKAGPIGNIHAGRKPALGNDPPESLPVWPFGSLTSGQLLSKAVFHQLSEGLTQFRGPLLCGDEQFVRKLNRGLHAVYCKPIFMGVKDGTRRTARLRRVTAFRLAAAFTRRFLPVDEKGHPSFCQSSPPIARITRMNPFLIRAIRATIRQGLRALRKFWGVWD